MRPFLFLPLALLCALSPARAARRPATHAPEPLRLLVAPAQRTWALEERTGGRLVTLLDGARVRAVRADGSEVAWTGIQRAPDGHSFTVTGPDVSVKVLAQWLPAGRLPSTLSLMPLVYARRPGVVLRELSVLHGARLPGIGGGVTVLEEGYQSWSPTKVAPLEPGQSVTSWWVTGVHGARRSLVAGYLSSVLGLNAMRVECTASGAVRASDISELRRWNVPVTSAGTPADALYLSWGRAPSDMLAAYASAARSFTHVMDPSPAFRPQPIPRGWCSWYEFYTNITQEGMVGNAETARRLYGTRDFRIVQMDDGFQKAAGDWDTNEKFPNGHRWLTDTIHRQGYQAGLWLAPFAVGERSALFREHPEWLLKRPNGEPAVLWDSNEVWGGRVYSLDPSLPAVRAWLRNLFRTVTRTWGYDYVKIDFLYYPLEPNTVMAGGMTPVEAYRAAMKAIRQGAGQQTYVLACGAPIGPTIGLCNGNRIGPDVNASWVGIVGGALNTANRQWMHNVFWQNDPDALMVRPPLTEDQARAWTTAVALSGGLTMLSDDLRRLSAERATLAGKALPVGGNAPVVSFGPAPVPGRRATAARIADMWSTRRSDAPALRKDDGAVVADLRPGSSHLAGPWQMRVGDEPAMDGANGEGWREVAPGALWETLSGLENYDGYGWYVVRFRIPPSAARVPLTLDLGRLDDADETFLNGKRIGAGGGMPPNYQSAAVEWRRYPVAAEDLRWTGDGSDGWNTLAIRIYDHGGYGGMVDVGAVIPPTVWRLPAEASPARLTVVGLFQWGYAPVRRSVDPARLGVAKAGQPVHVWDVWNARYLGRVTRPLTVSQPGSSVLLLSLSPDLGRPQVIGTDAHATSGAADVLGVSWVARHRALKGRSRARAGETSRLAVTVPPGYTLAGVQASGADVVREDSAPGVAVLRFTARAPAFAWTIRYAPARP